MAQKAVRFAGLNEDGQPMFDIRLSYPDPSPNDCDPTEAMLDALHDFYLADLSHLTDWQAHTLLSVRDYAKTCAERIFPDYSPNGRLLMSRLIAAFLSNSKRRGADITAWSDRRFETGVDECDISETRHYKAAYEFAGDLETSTAIEGCELAGI